MLVAIVALAMLPGRPADAERFRILEGERHDEASGTTTPLTGTFLLEPVTGVIVSAPQVDLDQFRIPEFDLRSGSEHFTAYQPPVYEGISTNLPHLRLLDSLALHGETLAYFFIGAGGNAVAASEDHVTFRNWSFRSTEGHAAYRDESGSGLPARFETIGELGATDAHYRIEQLECALGPAPSPTPPIIVVPPGTVFIPPGRGGTILVPDGDATILLTSPELATFEIVGPAPGATIFAVETPDAVEIVGRNLTVEPLSEGTLRIANPIGVSLGTAGFSGVGAVTRAVATDRGAFLSLNAKAAVPLTPTLDELGITATAGASISVDFSGRVTVESSGPLEINAGRLEIEGLTGLRLIASAGITVGPAGIQLPEGATLELSSVDPGPGPIIATPLCPHLVFIQSEVVAVQPFRIVAAREVPVAIQLHKKRRGRRHHPAFHRRLRVAILGSDDLDVRDIDRRSLRLASESESDSRAMRRSRRRDVNRDGIADLLVRFRNPGIALGDTELCLTGATYHGPAIAGCTALEPPRIRNDEDSDSDSESDRNRRRRWRRR